MLRLFGSKVIVHDSVLFVKLEADLLGVVSILKYHSLLRYDVLLDVVGVDLGNGDYLVSYSLLSTKFNCRLLLSCVVAKEVSSLGRLYSSSVWLERELYDMLGLGIKGHEDLRRLLTDYGFKGFPLKRSFVLGEDSLYSESCKLSKKR